MTTKIQTLVTCDVCLKEQAFTEISDARASGWRTVRLAHITGGAIGSAQVCSGSCAIIWIDRVIPVPE